MKNDNVNSPKHYKLEGLDVEVIDIIKATVKYLIAFVTEILLNTCLEQIRKMVLRTSRKQKNTLK